MSDDFTWIMILCLIQIYSEGYLFYVKWSSSHLKLEHPDESLYNLKSSSFNFLAYVNNVFLAVFEIVDFILLLSKRNNKLYSLCTMY